MDSYKPLLTNKHLKEHYDTNPYKRSKWVGTKIYNSFRSVRYTDKGKKKGSPEGWSDFFYFIEEVQDGYTPDKYLQRHDQTKPYSKDNISWVHKWEVHSKQSGRSLRYKNKTYKVSELSMAFEIPSNLIRRKLRDFISVKEIIEGKRKKVVRNCTSPTDINSKKEIRAKASKMLSSYRHKDKNKGWVSDLTIEFMLEDIFYKECYYCQTKEQLGCDRLDNNKGHTKENVVPCCRTCNMIRNNFFNPEEMKKLAKFIKENIYAERDRLE